MGHQRALHLKRADAVAAALDDVVGAAHKPVVAVLIEVGEVAGEVIVVMPNRVGQLLVAVVAPEQS